MNIRNFQFDIFLIASDIWYRTLRDEELSILLDISYFISSRITWVSRFV